MSRLKFTNTRTTVAAAGAVVLSVVLAGCSADPTVGPNAADQNDIQFFDGLNVTEFEETLGTSPARVEISIVRQEDRLVAHRVEVRADGGLLDEEEIASRVTEIRDRALAVDLGDLVVAFTGETRFETKSGEELTEGAFLERLQHTLDEGHLPAIVARRAPPVEPQREDDAAFTAQALRLNDEADELEIAINVDRSNFTANDTPPPDGWLLVLGLSIEVRVSDDMTEIEEERPDHVVEDFAGVVESVNMDLGQFVLDNDIVVRVVGETTIRYEAGDEHRLPSLGAVKEALDAGETVFAAGEGVVEGTEPLTLAAIDVVFEVEPPPTEDFEGVVASVDLEHGTFSIGDDLVVRIDDRTEIVFEEGDAHRLPSLAAVQEALTNGQMVFTAGHGEVEGTEPLSLLAARVVFEVEPPAVEDFEGQVASVDLEQHRFTIGDDVVVIIGDDTNILFEEGDELRLPSLEAVQAALEAGTPVVAAGHGVVEGTEPLTLVAQEVVFEVSAPPPPSSAN